LTPTDGVPDDVYERVAAVFDDRELAQVIAVAARSMHGTAST